MLCSLKRCKTFHFVPRCRDSFFFCFLLKLKILPKKKKKNVKDKKSMILFFICLKHRYMTWMTDIVCRFSGISYNINCVLTTTMQPFFNCHSVQTDSSAQLIIHLQFNNSPAFIRHAGPDVHHPPLVRHAWAIGLVPHKVGEILIFVHQVIQLVVAGSRVLEDAHSQPVLVQVVVERHREHDSNQLVAVAAAHVKQLVGHDAHSAWCRVVVLGEGAHLGPGGANGGLRRAEGETTFHVDPCRGHGEEMESCINGF